MFASYYVKYRGVGDVPGLTDPEALIFIQFANDAIQMWRQMDGVLWNELFNTAKNSDAQINVVNIQTTYSAPSDMDFPGGYIKVYREGSSDFGLVPLIQPYEAQIQADLSNYAYFTGNPNDGFVLNYTSPTNLPNMTYTMDYDYYKLPRGLQNATDTPEMRDPMFCVWYALRERLENSRNTLWQKADQEMVRCLAAMETRNAMGTNFNSWVNQDSQGGGFGAPAVGLGANILLNG